MSGRTIFYDLPQDREVMAAVARTIPDGWQWIDGFFGASKELYDKDLVAENTQLQLSRFNGVRIVGVDDIAYEDEHNMRKRERGFMLPKVGEVVLGDKYFSSVVFDTTGFEVDHMKVGSAKELMAGLIEKGYLGHASAFSDHKDNSRLNNPETMYFRTTSRKKPHLGHKGPLTPLVRLAWNPEYGGKRENLDPIVSKLEELGLKRLALQWS